VKTSFCYIGIAFSNVFFVARIYVCLLIRVSVETVSFTSRVKVVCVEPFTAQRLLYLPPSGHYMYRTVVTICTASLTFTNPTFCPHSVLCVLCGYQNKQRLFPYATLTDWFL
jgi:hypothetical protein